MSRYYLHPDVGIALDVISLKLGDKIVRESLKAWLLRKSMAGEVPTRRQVIPRNWLANAWKKQLGRCAICKQEVPLSGTVGDHFIALVSAGMHDKRNIRACCRSCNAEKGANNPSEEAKRTGTLLINQLPK